MQPFWVPLLAPVRKGVYADEEGEWVFSRTIGLTGSQENCWQHTINFLFLATVIMGNTWTWSWNKTLQVQVSFLLIPEQNHTHPYVTAPRVCVNRRRPACGAYRATDTSACSFRLQMLFISLSKFILSQPAEGFLWKVFVVALCLPVCVCNLRELCCLAKSRHTCACTHTYTHIGFCLVEMKELWPSRLVTFKWLPF